MSDKDKTIKMIPIRLPETLVEWMDDFLKRRPKLAIISRNELARRAISEWLSIKEEEKGE